MCGLLRQVSEAEIGEPPHACSTVRDLLRVDDRLQQLSCCVVASGSEPLDGLWHNVQPSSLQ